jgi:hypothetical protein
MVLGFVTEAQARKLHRVAERLERQGLREESSVLHAFLEEIAGQSEMVSAAEAAEILFVTPQTVRNWVRAGILAGGQDATGHFYVYREALVPAIRIRRAMPDIADETISDDDIDAAIAAVRADRRVTSTSCR